MAINVLLASDTLLTKQGPGQPSKGDGDGSLG